MLARIGRQTFHDAFSADNDAHDLALYLDASFGPEKQSAELNDATNTFLIADDRGSTVGYAKLREGETAVVVLEPREA